MIFNGSRYANEPVKAIADSAGVSHPTVFGPTPSFPRNFSYYTVKQGDRLDNLAYQFFGRSDLWWLIADANPEIFYPLLTFGSTIRIPAPS